MNPRGREGDSEGTATVWSRWVVRVKHGPQGLGVQFASWP